MRACIYCQNESRYLAKIRDGIKINKIKSDSQNFWDKLISSIKDDNSGKEEAGAFSFSLALWSKRLIPLPVVIAGIVIIFLNLNFTNKNLVDEYIFGASFNNVVSSLNDRALF